MAGYSGTPLPKKLGIREQHRVLIIRGPVELNDLLAPLPDGVHVQTSLRGKKPFDVALMFATKSAQLTRYVPALMTRMEPAAGLWICWPKKSSGMPTELSDSVVRAFGLDTGLVDNKVCAIDETWSALRFVIRLKDRG